MESNFVSVATLREADAVLMQCWREGFYAVASSNLNGKGYIVEYWRARR